jgi:hypothetical protein
VSDEYTEEAEPSHVYREIRALMQTLLVVSNGYTDAPHPRQQSPHPDIQNDAQKLDQHEKSFTDEPNTTSPEVKNPPDGGKSIPPLLRSDAGQEVEH